jgi:hypothetical protein
VYPNKGAISRHFPWIYGTIMAWNASIVRYEGEIESAFLPG